MLPLRQGLHGASIGNNACPALNSIISVRFASVLPYSSCTCGSGLLWFCLYFALLKLCLYKARFFALVLWRLQPVVAAATTKWHQFMVAPHTQSERALQCRVPSWASPWGLLCCIASLLPLDNQQGLSTTGSTSAVHQVFVWRGVCCIIQGSSTVRVAFLKCMSQSSSKGHCLVVCTACCRHVGWLCTRVAQHPKDTLFSYVDVCACFEMVVVQVAELTYLLPGTHLVRANSRAMPMPRNQYTIRHDRVSLSVYVRAHVRLSLCSVTCCWWLAHQCCSPPSYRCTQARAGGLRAAAQHTHHHAVHAPHIRVSPCYGLVSAHYYISLSRCSSLFAAIGFQPQLRAEQSMSFQAE